MDKDRGGKIKRSDDRPAVNNTDKYIQYIMGL